MPEKPRRTATVSLPNLAAIEDESAFRRHSDEILWQVFQESLTEMSHTLHGYNGDMGILGRVTAIETNLANLSERTNAVYELLLKRQEDKGQDYPLTKSKLAEMLLKFLQPVFTAALIWLLLTLFPKLFTHITP